MEPYTKEMITWARHLDVVNLRTKIGYLPGYVVLRLFRQTDPDQDEMRINVGFSKDRKRLYIKLTDRGVKLSDVGDHRSRHGKTFSLQAILKQFGQTIIGQYKLLEGAGFDEDKILAFEKIEESEFDEK